VDEWIRKGLGGLVAWDKNIPAYSKEKIKKRERKSK
jgi:hypothetical protein